MVTAVGLQQTGASSQPQDRDCFLAFCRTINTITGICAALCLVAHLMAISHRTSVPITDPHRIYRQLIRVYSVGTACLVILTETEWQRFLSLVRVMDFWVARGFFQIFLSVLTLELATAEGDSDFSKSVRLYRLVAGYSMMVCGLFYLVGGACCFGVLKRARHRRVIERLRAQENLMQIEKQREDLRNLLSSDV